MTIEEGIGDTNMLEIVLVELVGISIVFLNLANFYLDVKVDSQPTSGQTEVLPA